MAAEPSCYLYILNIRDIFSVCFVHAQMAMLSHAHTRTHTHTPVHVRTHYIYILHHS